MYWENYDNKEEALKREKQIKSQRREKKITLIETDNLHWKDLYDDVVELGKIESLRSLR